MVGLGAQSPFPTRVHQSAPMLAQQQQQQTPSYPIRRVTRTSSSAGGSFDRSPGKFLNTLIHRKINQL